MKLCVQCVCEGGGERECVRVCVCVCVCTCMCIPVLLCLRVDSILVSSCSQKRWLTAHFLCVPCQSLCITPRVSPLIPPLYHDAVYCSNAFHGSPSTYTLPTRACSFHPSVLIGRPDSQARYVPFERGTAVSSTPAFTILTPPTATIQHRSWGFSRQGKVSGDGEEGQGQG